MVENGVFLRHRPNDNNLLFRLYLSLFFMILRTLIRINGLQQLQRIMLTLVRGQTTLLCVIRGHVRVDNLFQHRNFPKSRKSPNLLLRDNRVTVRLRVQSGLVRRRVPLNLIHLPYLQPLVIRRVIFPTFVLYMMFIMTPSVLSRKAIPITGILPSLMTIQLTLRNGIGTRLNLIMPVTQLLPFVTSNTIRLLRGNLNFVRQRLLTIFRVKTFAPGSHSGQLHYQVLHSLPLNINGNGLAFSLTFRGKVRLTLLRFMTLFARAISGPSRLIDVTRNLNVNRSRLPFLTTRAQNIFLHRLGRNNNPIDQKHLQRRQLSVRGTISPIPYLQLKGNINLFNYFRGAIRPITNRKFRYPDQ